MSVSNPIEFNSLCPVNDTDIQAIHVSGLGLRCLCVYFKTS